MKQSDRSQIARTRSRKTRAFTGHAIYEAYSSALPDRAKSVAQHLSTLRETFTKLFSDENFLTLLQAEAITTIPAYLSPILEAARSEHEID